MVADSTVQDIENEKEKERNEVMIDHVVFGLAPNEFGKDQRKLVATVAFTVIENPGISYEELSETYSIPVFSSFTETSNPDTEHVSIISATPEQVGIELSSFLARNEVDTVNFYAYSFYAHPAGHEYDYTTPLVVRGLEKIIQILARQTRKSLTFNLLVPLSTTMNAQGKKVFKYVEASETLAKILELAGAFPMHSFRFVVAVVIVGNLTGLASEAKQFLTATMVRRQFDSFWEKFVSSVFKRPNTEVEMMLRVDSIDAYSLGVRVFQYLLTPSSATEPFMKEFARRVLFHLAFDVVVKIVKLHIVSSSEEITANSYSTRLGNAVVSLANTFLVIRRDFLERYGTKNVVFTDTLLDAIGNSLRIAS